MLGVLVTLVLSLIIFTVFNQIIDVRVLASKHITVSVSLTFFSVLLSDFGKKRGKRKQRFIKRVKRTPFYLKIANQLIRRSTIIVSSCTPSGLGNLRSDSATLFASISSPILLNYLKRTASSYLELNRNTDNIDITFSFSLASLIISLFKASYYTVKKRIKRWARNVG